MKDHCLVYMYVHCAKDEIFFRICYYLCRLKSIDLVCMKQLMHKVGVSLIPELRSMLILILYVSLSETVSDHGSVLQCFVLKTWNDAQLRNLQMDYIDSM